MCSVNVCGSLLLGTLALLCLPSLCSYRRCGVGKLRWRMFAPQILDLGGLLFRLPQPRDGKAET